MRGVEEAIEGAVKEAIEGAVEEAIEGAVEKVVVEYRATKNQFQEHKLDRSTKCQGAIEEAGAFSNDPLGIEEVSRLH